jgi:hypothetical protein
MTKVAHVAEDFMRYLPRSLIQFQLLILYRNIAFIHEDEYIGCRTHIARIHRAGEEQRYPAS